MKYLSLASGISSIENDNIVPHGSVANKGLLKEGLARSARVCFLLTRVLLGVKYRLCSHVRIYFLHFLVYGRLWKSHKAITAPSYGIHFVLHASHLISIFGTAEYLSKHLAFMQPYLHFSPRTLMFSLLNISY